MQDKFTESVTDSDISGHKSHVFSLGTNFRRYQTIVTSGLSVIELKKFYRYVHGEVTVISRKFCRG